jgi:hypothetical protein
MNEQALGRFARAHHFKPCAGLDSLFAKHRFWPAPEVHAGSHLPGAKTCRAIFAQCGKICRVDRQITPLFEKLRSKKAAKILTFLLHVDTDQGERK